MTRTLLTLSLCCAFAAAQDTATLDKARAAVVGVTARRVMDMGGRQFPMNLRQVGVVVGKGLVLTPSMSRDAENVRVFVAGANEPLEAEVVDSDASFTVIRVDDLELEPVAFVRDWKPAVGQKLLWVGVLGGAGRWAPIVKEGTVDALIEDDASAAPLVYSDPPFAGPVNASGALVLNGAGEAVGVVGVRTNPNQGGGMRRMMRRQQGVPVVRPAAEFAQYLGGEIVERGMLGITLEALTEKVAEAMGLKGARGVIVTQVTPGSGAAKAGVLAQDIITEVDGTAVADAADLQKVLRGKGAGTEVAVKLKRLTDAGPADHELKVTLTARDDDDKSKRFRAKRFGFTAEPLTPTIRRTYQLGEDVQGAHVRRVVQGGPASLGRPTALRRGDVILKVGQVPVTDMETLKKALQSAEDGKPVTLFVRHATDTRFVEVTPEKAGE